MALVGVLALAGSVGARRTLAAFGHRSSRLDVQLLLGRQLLRAVGALPALLSSFWLATQLVFALDRVATPHLAAPSWLVTAAYTLALFVAWDASRYVAHRLMHEIPVLWAFHQVHHSAEVLTPLTFHRIHPVESLVYQVRHALVTAVVTGVFFWLFRGEARPVELFGVHAVGFVLNGLTGNLRHSHVWLTFGPLERWLLSPAQHQIHHGEGTDRQNYGTWLAIWDRMAGSLALADAPPERFGIPADERNHGDDLISAWLGPFRAAVRVLRRYFPRGATSRAGVGLPGSVR
ncbi:MAG: sterol desaturase family protein [Alphaproteobacteria bacterium]|nr:sterol desaturase family protein [Alphaproteobacteria bacterium]